MSLIDVLDLAGVYVFALSGCLVARKRGLDLVGLAALGLITGLAGGITRDVLLGDLPPHALRSGRMLVTALIAAATVVVVPHFYEWLRHPVRVLDALGLGLFASVGVSRALDAGVSTLAVVIVGTVAAVGGGVLRDLLADEVPEIFAARSRLYAIPAALGAIVTVLGFRLEVPEPPVQAVAVSATVALRLFALRFGWHAPLPDRLRRS